MTAMTEPRTMQRDDYTFADAATYRRMAQARQAELIAELIVSASRAVKRTFGGLYAYFAERMARAKAYDQLMSLDERMLKDIGINRGDVPMIIEGVMPYGRYRGPANENLGLPANANRPRTAA